MTLSERLKLEAIDLGLCRQWQLEWEENPTKQQLLEKWLTGIDFAIAHDWPKKEFIKRHFFGIMHDYNIYIDEKVDIDDAEGMIVLLGKCTGTIKTRGFHVTDIYILHDSDVKIVSYGMAKCYVNPAAAATVKVVSHDNSEIKQYPIKTGEAHGRN